MLHALLPRWNEGDPRRDPPADKLEAAKKKGEIVRIRTIKPNKKTYIHIGVKKSGKTVAGKVHHEK